MKKILTAITVLIIIASGNVRAESPVSVIYKAGGFPKTSSSRHPNRMYGFMMKVEEENCNFCLSPYFVTLNNSVIKNNGFGLDYVYKVNKYGNTFKIAAGIVGFKEKLNDGERGNFHIGIGIEIFGSKNSNIILSLDYFSNGRNILNREDQVSKNIPANMISIGFKFK